MTGRESKWRDVRALLAPTGFRLCWSGPVDNGFCATARRYDQQGDERLFLAVTEAREGRAYRALIAACRALAATQSAREAEG